MAMLKSPAHRRYTVRVFVAMSFYVGTLFAAEHLIDDRGLTGPMAVILAILPGISVAAVFWALGRLLIEERDEYLRLVLTRQLLVASGLTMAIATVYGFLEHYRIMPVVELYFISMLFFVAFGVAALVNRWLYDDRVPC